MSLQDRFIFGDLLIDGPIRCYAGRNSVSGKQVLIHVGLKVRSGDLLDAALEHPQAEALLEQGQEGDARYVVTERKPSDEPEGDDAFNQRRIWAAKAKTPPDAGKIATFFHVPAARENPAARQKSAPPTPPSPPSLTGLFDSPKKPAEEPAGMDAEPGEFTQLFQAAKPPATAPAPQTPAPTEPVHPVPAEDADPDFTRIFQTGSHPIPQPMPGAEEPGEFTRVFVSAQPATPPAATPPVTPTQRPEEPGEFTREFQAAAKVTAPAPEPPAPTQVHDEPGGFTQLFEAAAKPTPASALEGPTRKLPIIPAQPSPPDQEAGEFTQLFQPVPTPAPVPERAPAQPSPEPHADPGEFTQLFQAPAKSPIPPPEAVTRPLPAVPPEPTRPVSRPEEPGEFTQLFQAANPTPRPDVAAGQATGAFQSPAAPAARSEYERETRLFDVPAQRPASLPSQAPGEFTASFQSGPSPARPAAPSPMPDFGPRGASPPPPQQPDAFDDLFGNSPSLPQPPQQPSYIPPPSGPAYSNYAGPSGSADATGVFESGRPASQQRFPGGAGEYTKMFEAPAAPTPFPAETKPAAPPPAPLAAQADHSKLIFGLIIGGVALLVIALVLYFVLR